MSEHKKCDRIENVVAEFLDGELQENALKFVAYLDENGLSPLPLPYEMDNGKTIGFKIPYNGHYLG